MVRWKGENYVGDKEEEDECGDKWGIDDGTKFLDLLRRPSFVFHAELEFLACAQHEPEADDAGCQR